MSFRRQRETNSIEVNPKTSKLFCALCDFCVNSAFQNSKSQFFGGFLKLIGIVIFLMFQTSLSVCQTYDLQFVQVLNDETNYDVKIQIQADSSTFGLGDANFVFTYDSSALSNPALKVAYNFRGGFYTNLAITIAAANKVSVNIAYNGSAAKGTIVPLTYIDVATIGFTIKNVNGSSKLRWNLHPPNSTNVFKDDHTVVPAGTLYNLDTALQPVQVHVLPSNTQTGSLPQNFLLDQNYPNPFNPSTTIRFGLPVTSRVTIKIFDLTGQVVETLLDDARNNGYYQLIWYPHGSSGIYFIVLQAYDESNSQNFARLTKKVIFLK